MSARMIPRINIGRGWKWILLGLWALAMIGLPLTSFPAITGLTGATVAPFSIIPLAVLALVWFIPYLARRGKLPKECLFLLIFAIFATAVAAYAFFQLEPVFKNDTVLNQTIRTFIPFGMGLAFFFITSAWHKDAVDLRRTLQFIHIGGAFMLVWAIIQALVLQFLRGHYPPVLAAIS